jgi:hypothetical protein
LAAAHYTIEMDLSADEIARQTIRWLSSLYITFYS